MDWRGGAGEVVDLLGFQQDGLGDVVAHQFETVVADEVAEVLFVAGEEVVEADHFVAFFEQCVAEVGAQESCGSGH